MLAPACAGRALWPLPRGCELTRRVSRRGRSESHHSVRLGAFWAEHNTVTGKINLFVLV
ncbi:hypothetical protein KL86PLE_40770 [uncultured Pleomorphomonas sp.]|uniref:Uncharacterized protein n=1 Tax=uncultured Pleomorphomonas sp. TaxID=442121 RepID=A0A212LHD8_9HYPH|nr:hypothetical protein KL86PLE_40770 [uncultured Pleomorphomonas sp.]